MRPPFLPRWKNEREVWVLVDDAGHGPEFGEFASLADAENAAIEVEVLVVKP